MADSFEIVVSPFIHQGSKKRALATPPNPYAKRRQNHANVSASAIPLNCSKNIQIPTEPTDASTRYNETSTQCYFTAIEEAATVNKEAGAHSSPTSGNIAAPAASTFRGAESNTTATESQKDQAIPIHTDSFERFFAIMLRSSVQDYVQAARCNDKSLDLWRVLCRRANLEVPRERIRPRYESTQATQHFDIRAALVLEESREALSRGLAGIQTKRDSLARALTSQHGVKQEFLPRMVTLDVEIRGKPNPRPLGITFLTLKCAPHENGTPRYFTDEQKQCLMPGQVLECSVDGGTAILGCVLPCKKERIHKHAEFDLLIFEQLPALKEGDSWTLTPVDAMTGPCRQFEACTRNPEMFPLLQAVLGHQQSPIAAGTNREVDNVKNSSLSQGGITVTTDPPSFAPTFLVPQLNENQEQAVSGFLKSSPESVTIVQGPPGTGKTSLLVATICRFLTPYNSASQRQRLVVCAPTNKAVSVLANRFLSAASDAYGCTVNMILVGDDDKLLESKKKCPLRPYFVYSWHDEVKNELKAIMTFFDPKNDSRRRLSRQDMAAKATGLQRRVIKGLSSLPDTEKNKVNELCNAVIERRTSTASIFYLAKQAYRAVKELKYDAIETDIMRSADVIFCTLCSSASRVMGLARRSTKFGALIVDEAAAATEPDLYIPFHLGPSRLLLVGDPKQLPSTVLSERAKRFGLDVSLQERLMSDHCRYDYTMLNVQYRMHPEISTFPSHHFYNGKICDGANVTSPTCGERAQLLDGRPYVFLQVDGVESKGHSESTCNLLEAAAVLDLVKRLCRANDTWSSPDRLRIITFYTAQVTLLRKTLSDNGFDNVLVSTVDSSQGCEADVVIVSLVKSNTAGFLTDDRRVNVALTRARHQLVCVGNVLRYPSMASAPTLYRLAADSQERNIILDIKSVGRPTKKIKTESLVS